MKTRHKEGFLGQKRHWGLAGACAATLCVLSCIVSPSGVKTPFPLADYKALDTVLQAGEPDRTVDLFEPALDITLPVDAQSPLQISFPVRVREQGSGQIVEYHWSRRYYGSWSEQREYLFNLLLLRAFFLQPAGLFEDTSGVSTTAALFARAQEHDRFTRYVDSAHAEEYERQSATTEEPRVLGIQIRVNDASDTVSLALVAPGSPAWRAGLRRGMAMLAVNDSVVTGDSAWRRFVRFLDADTVGTVKVTARGPGGIFSRDIAREKVSFPSVLADSIGSVGYIAVSSFTTSTVGGGSTYTEFRQALKDTKRFPATVLDLRGNGGGSLNITLQMCEEVLSGGIVFKVVQRRFEGGASLRHEVTYTAHAGESGENRRFVLLADSGSASASELLMAAMRDNLASPFVGTHTYGKGVGQAAFKTPGKGYSLVTYGRVRTASGLDYNGTGLLPTHPSTAKPDAMLAEAVQVAQSSILAKGQAASQPPGGMLENASRVDWNRRQAARPGVQELVFPAPPLGLD